MIAHCPVEEGPGSAACNTSYASCPADVWTTPLDQAANVVHAASTGVLCKIAVSAYAVGPPSNCSLHVVRPAVVTAECFADLAAVVVRFPVSLGAKAPQRPPRRHNGVRMAGYRGHWAWTGAPAGP